MTVEDFLERFDRHDTFSKKELQRFITDYCECVQQEFYPRCMYSLIENNIVFSVAGRFFRVVWADWLGTRESEDAWECKDKDVYLNALSLTEVEASFALVRVYKEKNSEIAKVSIL